MSSLLLGCSKLSLFLGLAIAISTSGTIVIANRAVVTKDVAPYSIVGSNPAKHFRYRFTESEIAQLLEMKWWQ